MFTLIQSRHKQLNQITIEFIWCLYSWSVRIKTQFNGLDNANIKSHNLNLQYNFAQFDLVYFIYDLYWIFHEINSIWGFCFVNNKVISRIMKRILEFITSRQVVVYVKSDKYILNNNVDLNEQLFMSDKKKSNMVKELRIYILFSSIWKIRHLDAFSILRKCKYGCR